MMMFPRATRLLIASALATASLATEASVTTYSSRTSFESLGSISYNYGFDDLDTSFAATGGTGLKFMADPWTTHGVTYNTGSNLVVGPSLGLGLTSNVFTSNSSNPGGLVSGMIGGSYNLFGFDLGTLLGASLANISLSTNLGTYSFLNQASPVSPASSFFGFSAGAGEHFTSFSISDVTAGAVPALDNVTLGSVAVSAIPEPETIALLLPGLLLLGLASRRRGSRPA
jgi:hypothetical protein